MRREHREAGGAHVGDLGAAGEVQHQVEVVDHEIEHDGDVGAAGLERRQARALEVPGVVEVGPAPRGCARLKRSMCPTWSWTPFALAPWRSARRPRRASPPAASPSGPGRPRSSARSPTSACAGVGTAIVTASTCAEQARRGRRRRGCRAPPRPPRPGPGRRRRRRPARTPWKLREVARVVPAEGADADHPDRKPARSRGNAARGGLPRSRGSSSTSGSGGQIAAGALQRLREVEIGIEEEAVGALERGDGLAARSRRAGGRSELRP